jgi:hypothetical protein
MAGHISSLSCPYVPFCPGQSCIYTHCPYAPTIVVGTQIFPFFYYKKSGITKHLFSYRILTFHFSVDWIHPAEDSDQWQAVVNTKIKFPIV